MRTQIPTSVQQRIELKNALLEKWNEVGIPKEFRTEVPTSLRQFAKWQNKQLGLEQIGSPNSMTKSGPCGHLVQEAERLIRVLAKTQAVRETKGDQIANLKAKQDRMNVLVQELTNKWHISRERCAELELKVKALKNQRDRLKEQNRKFKKRLSVVVLPLNSLQPGSPETN
jgi:hypothetical protein